MQLIADYYAFASPTVTGQWKLIAKSGAWRLAFRGGELVDFEAPEGATDLIAFAAEVGAISTSNLTVLRAFPGRGDERAKVIAELLGGADELLKLRRRHALYAFGALLCDGVESAEFSDRLPESSHGYGLDALALPYNALCLQSPERLHEAIGDALEKTLRLTRNPKVPVAGLQLDREALHVAKKFTSPTAVRLVINGAPQGTETIVVYATVITLMGAEMLAEDHSEPEDPEPVLPREVVRPTAIGVPKSSASGVFERVPTGVAPPISENEGEVAAVEPKAAAAKPEPATVPDTIAAFLKLVADAVLTEAETMLKRLPESEARKKVLADFLAANDGRGGDPGGAMITALSGLQEFTESYPEDHLGPAILARLYDSADNTNLAKVFQQQAERLGSDQPEVRDWQPKE